jgi:hypothetical protein
MSEEQIRGRQAPPKPADEERLAALDETDLFVEADPEGFAAAVDEIIGAHADLLHRLAQ